MTSDGGNRVQVGRRIDRIAGVQPAAIDQHQRAKRAEAAQVDRGGPGGPQRAPFSPALTWGSVFSRSSTCVVPWSLISALPTVVTGLVLLSLSLGMRDPVTMISAGAAGTASCAEADPARTSPADARNRTLMRARLLRTTTFLP